ncbi:Xaa-Pro aminopeptidase [alpha proteobacterium AAP81b]|nr:Xaa-Pro aminopeptidase [alpha proteobacterium AAP81b]
MILTIAALLAVATPTAPPASFCQTELTDPAVPAVLPLRDRAALQDRWLKERLETIVPALMRENGVDMWILVARENHEDPVVTTMLDGKSLHARRRTILVFFDPGGGKPVERLTVSRYGLAGLFTAAWDPAKEPDQWRRLGDIVAERAPKRIAINVSPLSAYADGLTASQRDSLVAALPPGFAERLVSGYPLALGWLETRIPAELDRWREIVRTAHAIIAEGLSARVIRPGVTTADDVTWWYRERIAGLKLDTWFHPSLDIHRAGAEASLAGDTVIRPGDLLWVDFGISYLWLSTDTQHMAYVLKPGETDAPAGLKAGLAAANAVQDSLTSSYATGLSGNEILAAARAKALAAGLDPSIYTHPIGFHGHAAGAAIGYWDNQGASDTGQYTLRAMTGWSIELAAKAKVPEWGGQVVPFKLEEDAWFDGTRVRYIDGRQTRLQLIPRQGRGVTDCVRE